MSPAMFYLPWVTGVAMVLIKSHRQGVNRNLMKGTRSKTQGYSMGYQAGLMEKKLAWGDSGRLGTTWDDLGKWGTIWGDINPGDDLG